MIDQRSFHSVELEDNPVLRHELNGIAPSRRRRDVRRFFWISTGISVLALVTLCYWTGITQCRYIDPMNPAICDPPHVSQAALRRSIFPVVAYGSLLIGLLLDFYFVGLPSGRLVREKESGHWDVMRTTALSTTQIIGAKYTSAQLRAWRVLTIEVALRTAVIAVLTVNAILGQIEISSALSNYFLLILLGILVVPGSVYILEPIWRMSMVVSMGLAISMQGRNLTSVALADFGALLSMRILQGILTAIYFLPVSILVEWLNSIHSTDDELALVSMLVFGTFGLLIYLFYRTGRRWMLRRALRLVSYN